MHPILIVSPHPDDEAFGCAGTVARYAERGVDAHLLVFTKGQVGTTSDGADSPELARRAAEQGVGIVPGTLFFSDGRGADRVRLSFSMVDEEQIDDGIERLASLLTT